MNVIARMDTMPLECIVAPSDKPGIPRPLPGAEGVDRRRLRPANVKNIPGTDTGGGGGFLATMGGDLATMGGDLATIGGDLAPMGGDLATMEGGFLATMGGFLAPMGGGLAARENESKSR